MGPVITYSLTAGNNQYILIDRYGSRTSRLGMSCELCVEDKKWNICASADLCMSEP